MTVIGNVHYIKCLFHPSWHVAYCKLCNETVNFICYTSVSIGKKREFEGNGLSLYRPSSAYCGGRFALCYYRPRSEGDNVFGSVRPSVNALTAVCNQSAYADRLLRPPRGVHEVHLRKLLTLYLLGKVITNLCDCMLVVPLSCQ